MPPKPEVTRTFVTSPLAFLVTVKKLPTKAVANASANKSARILFILNSSKCSYCAAGFHRQRRVFYHPNIPILPKSGV